MAKSYISMKYDEFTEKFNRFFIHKKKVKALENYATVQEFEGAKYIRLLKELLKDGFLDSEEERFLEYQIKKAEIDAFTWSHKTKWLKREMQRLEAARNKKPDAQIYIPFDKPLPMPNMKFPVGFPLSPEKSINIARI